MQDGPVRRRWCQGLMYWIASLRSCYLPPLRESPGSRCRQMLQEGRILWILQRHEAALQDGAWSLQDEPVRRWWCRGLIYWIAAPCSCYVPLLQESPGLRRRQMLQGGRILQDAAPLQCRAALQDTLVLLCLDVTMHYKNSPVRLHLHPSVLPPQLRPPLPFPDRADPSRLAQARHRSMYRYRHC